MSYLELEVSSFDWGCLLRLLNFIYMPGGMAWHGMAQIQACLQLYYLWQLFFLFSFLAKIYQICNE